MRVPGVAALCLLAAGAMAADTHLDFNAAQLKEGRFVYRTTLRGEPLGETTLEIRRRGAHFVLSMNAPEIEQSWRAEIEKSFKPRSASLAMKGKNGPYSMSLTYDGANITGEEREGDVIRSIQASSEGFFVIDQRVDWAAMMALDLPLVVATRVFDPSTGFSDLRGKVVGPQSIKTALGESESLRLDYTIHKRDHVENYTVYATRQTPRYMLREDMPNGLVSELVRIEP